MEGYPFSRGLLGRWNMNGKRWKIGKSRYLLLAQTIRPADEPLGHRTQPLQGPRA